MKNLSLTFCLVITALLAGVGSGHALPNCNGPYILETWTDCSGRHTFTSTYKVNFLKDGRRYLASFKTGDIYDGNWKYGLPHGYGTYSWANGNKYVGFSEFDASTTGTIYFLNGDKYTGEFKNEKQHGRGVYYYSNGTAKEGIWKNGSFQYAQKTPYSRKPSVLRTAFI